MRKCALVIESDAHLVGKRKQIKFYGKMNKSVKRNERNLIYRNSLIFVMEYVDCKSGKKSSEKNKCEIYSGEWNLSHFF